MKFSKKKYMHYCFKLALSIKFLKLTKDKKKASS